MQNQPSYPQLQYPAPRLSRPPRKRRSTANLRFSFPWTDPGQITANVQGQVTDEQITMLKQPLGLISAGGMALFSFVALTPSFLLYQSEHNPLFLLISLVPLTLALLAVIWPIVHN